MNTESTELSPSGHRCAKCGALMTAQTLRGLCPHCLAIFAFGSNAEADREVEIFAAARRLPEEQRAAYLDQACAGDVSLRQRIKDLFQFDPATDSFLASATSQSQGATQALTATIHYIGDYELQEEIGRGGMGVVYKARQASLNRVVAVKMIISGEFAGTAERKRFRREAESAAQLRHPNIVTIHEVGEHEGRSYFSMDYIEGKTLSAQLKEETLPPARAAALVKTLAEAVHFAHQRGTLHRDLKPQNILMDAEDRPHILDFGLARPVERDAAMTRTGDVMGSPSYMPPEQASGRVSEIGPASDVYSLGAILYEALTGRPPFTGETAVEVLTQVINLDPVPLRKRNPNVPADLETICLKCLEKRTERRYHSAQALADELERFLNFEPILARPASRLRKGWSWSQRNPWVFAAGLGFIALVMLCVAYGLWEKTQVLHSRLATGKEQNLLSKDFLSAFNLVGSTGSFAERRPSERDFSPAAAFLSMMPGLYFFLYFIGRKFRNSYQAQNKGGAAMSQQVITLHAAVGVAAAMGGIGYLLLQIRSWVWQGAGHLLGMEIPGVFCALFLIFVGFRMVWEAVGIHETSRYRALVGQALDRQLAADSRRWVGIASWIGAGYWVLSMVGLGYFVLFRSDAGPDKRSVVATLICVLWIAGETALATLALRNRWRLLTFVFIPATFTALGILFVGLTAGKETSVGLAVFGIISAILTAVVLRLLENPPASTPAAPRRFPVNPWLDLAFGVAFAVGFFALFYAEENARGKAAWEKCKREAEAGGAKLDWATYVPPLIPDEQNIFKAPHMQEWFTGHGYNFFGKTLMSNTPFASGFDHGRTTNITVAFLTLAGTDETPAAGRLVVRYGDAQAKAQAALMLSNVIGPVTASPPEFPLMARTKEELRPAGIILQHDHSLTAAEVAAFLPTNVGFVTANGGNIRVEPDGPIAFRVSVDQIVSASDVLAWIHDCEPQLEVVRLAVERPFARMDGIYDDPIQTPIPSFTSIRALSQMLGAGSQASLLRGDSANAFAQLTFMHDTLRLTQGPPPNGHPETLVAAMTEVAVATLYARMIEYGLGQHAWSDSQLAAFERQINETDLLPPVRQAFIHEQANLPRVLDMIYRGLPANPFHANNEELLKYYLTPHGWYYQNEVTHVRYAQLCVEGVDLQRHLILPAKGILFTEWVKDLNPELSPNSFLEYALPNFTRALSTTGQNQTAINLTHIACALERYRLAHHEYPLSLEELVPNYISRLPHDPIGGNVPAYRREEQGRFSLSSPAWKLNERWTWPKSVF